MENVMYNGDKEFIIDVLAKKLIDEGIPFFYQPHLFTGGTQIIYQERGVSCEVEMDTGYESLAISGLLTEEEKIFGDKAHGLTIEEVFDRLHDHYIRDFEV